MYSDAVRSERQIIVVNSGLADCEFTVKNFSGNLRTNENTVNVRTMEKCFKNRIDGEMGNIVHRVEDRI